MAPGWKIGRSDLIGAEKFLRATETELVYTPEFCRGDFVFAQTAEFRAKDLARALSQKSIDAVWCVRGGSGTQDTLPLLPRRKQKQDRHLLGLSDITALHIFLAQQWGWQTLHAPVLARVGGGRATKNEVQETFEMLRNERSHICFEGLRPLNKTALRLKKQIKGRVIGGNLCVLEALLGTPFQAKTRGKVLFLEEVHERGYRIMRSLTHLQQAGAFKGVKAVVWGDVTGGDEADGSNHAWTAVQKFFADLDVPAFRGIQSGHGDVQRPLPLNTPAKLVAGAGKKNRVFTLEVQAPQFGKPRGRKHKASGPA